MNLFFIVIVIALLCVVVHEALSSVNFNGLQLDFNVKVNFLENIFSLCLSLCPSFPLVLLSLLNS